MALRLEDLPPSIRKKVDEKLYKKSTPESKRKELKEDLLSKGFLEKPKNKGKREEVIILEPTALDMSSDKGNRWISIFRNNYENACRVYSREMESQIKHMLNELGEDVHIFSTESDGRRTVIRLTLGKDGDVIINGKYTPLCEDCAEDPKHFSQFPIPVQEQLFEKVKSEISNL